MWGDYKGDLTQSEGAVQGGGCVSVVVAIGLGINVGNGGVGNRRSAVMSCGGGA